MTVASVPVQYGDHDPIAADTPCLTCGSAAGRPVMDHCHIHGWTRGALCSGCNSAMASVDRRRIPRTAVRERSVDITELVAHALRCPDCAPFGVADLIDAPNTLFVNVGVTPATRALLNATAARAGALVGYRVPNHQMIRAALAVADAHPDEMAEQLNAARAAEPQE